MVLLLFLTLLHMVSQTLREKVNKQVLTIYNFPSLESPPQNWPALNQQDRISNS